VTRNARHHRAAAQRRDPVISIGMSADKRDRRVKPGDDENWKC
jgi:hypothetical protein